MILVANHRFSGSKNLIKEVLDTPECIYRTYMCDVMVKPGVSGIIVRPTDKGQPNTKTWIIGLITPCSILLFFVKRSLVVQYIARYITTS